ncbi:hypothetical protein [uncultured Salipiger sp.]|uniref:hypothetical protein n=1 Tax=uncultured Salipiger sp. TaxID=499810 RepID=UPI00338F795E
MSRKKRSQARSFGIISSSSCMALLPEHRSEGGTRPRREAWIAVVRQLADRLDPAQFVRGDRRAKYLEDRPSSAVSFCLLHRQPHQVFPATAIAPNANAGFAAEGFTRRPWRSTEPVRKIVNTAFAAATLAPFGPHSFRHMLARHAAKTCTSVAEIVATSQNLGHTDVLTTLRSYGQISRERQRELITGESGDNVLDD